MFVAREGAAIQKCYRCGDMKPADEFAWRRKLKGRRDSFCRRCRAAYKREHYADNRQRYIREACVRKQRLAIERTGYLLQFFRRHPCADCGESDPVVLEFDHLGDDKLFDIGQALPYRNWESILAEIEKCDVVCANCHRRRTATRRGSLRSRLLTKDDRRMDREDPSWAGPDIAAGKHPS